MDHLRRTKFYTAFRLFPRHAQEFSKGFNLSHGRKYDWCPNLKLHLFDKFTRLILVFMVVVKKWRKTNASMKTEPMNQRR